MLFCAWTARGLGGPAALIAGSAKGEASVLMVGNLVKDGDNSASDKLWLNCMIGLNLSDDLARDILWDGGLNRPIEGDGGNDLRLAREDWISELVLSAAGLALDDTDKDGKDPC